MLGLSVPLESSVTKATREAAGFVPTDEELDAMFSRIETRPAGAEEDYDEDAGLVQRLWNATATSDRELVIEDWAPEVPVDTRVGRYRWGWWPVLLGALVVGMFLVALNLRGIPAGQAEDVRNDWAAAGIELKADLPDAAASASIITDPQAEAGDIASARAGLIGFATSAASLENVIEKPFPTPPPLASGRVFDGLKPIKETLEEVTALATNIDSQLADAITYRSLIDVSFLLPTLPIVADEGTVTDLGGEIANAIGTSRDSVRQLPIGEEFADHRAAAQALVARLDTWQASYLDALRLGDIDAATDLKAEINSRVNDLRSTVGEPLSRVAADVAADFEALGLRLDSALAELDQFDP